MFTVELFELMVSLLVSLIVGLTLDPLEFLACGRHRTISDDITELCADVLKTMFSEQCSHKSVSTRKSIFLMYR